MYEWKAYYTYFNGQTRKGDTLTVYAPTIKKALELVEAELASVPAELVICAIESM